MVIQRRQSSMTCKKKGIKEMIRAWVKRTPEEIEELKKKIEEHKKQLSNDISR